MKPTVAPNRVYDSSTGGVLFFSAIMENVFRMSVLDSSERWVNHKIA